MCSIVDHSCLGGEDFVFSRKSIFIQGHLCPGSALGDTVDLEQFTLTRGGSCDVAFGNVIKLWKSWGQCAQCVCSRGMRGIVCDLSVCVTVCV